VNPPFDADLIRHALARVRACRKLWRSPGLQNFLSCRLDTALAGRPNEIKEAVISVGVFGHTPACDSTADLIARVRSCFRVESLIPLLPAE
jgi:hypothetical protein